MTTYTAQHIDGDEFFESIKTWCGHDIEDDFYTQYTPNDNTAIPIYCKDSNEEDELHWMYKFLREKLGLRLSEKLFIDISW